MVRLRLLVLLATVLAASAVAAGFIDNWGVGG